MWDYKPKLEEQFDKDLPDSIRMGQRITTMTVDNRVCRSPLASSSFPTRPMWTMGQRTIASHRQYGGRYCGPQNSAHQRHQSRSRLYVCDDGNEVPGKPSLGAWLSYGLGSESNDLPSFVVLTPTWTSTAAAQALFTRMWSSGFLPTRHTGVALRSGGDPVLYLPNPPGVQSTDRRLMLDASVNSIGTVTISSGILRS